MIYEVSHRTVYKYSQPVSVSHHLLHLTPRTASFQLCLESAIEIAPGPTVRTLDIDYFGNPTTFVTIQQGHLELVLHALSVIDVSPRAAPPPEATDSWERVAERLTRDRSEPALEALEFTFASPYVPLRPELQRYAEISFPPGRPVLAGALELTRRIFKEFVYKPGATSISTGVAQSFAMRCGVCQDFAHIQLACLRSLGLPARYVSGYLLTRPPEGKEKLVGSDASHAWVSLWVPDHGWVDLDPTNDVIPGEEHVTLAWGRDYGDVSPVSGVMFGGGEHQVTVGVDVAIIG